MVVITRTSLVRTILALSASWNSIVVSSSSSSIATTTTTTSTTADTPPLSVADPLLLRVARGEAVERTPVWMMRQAGRHMKAYRDLVPMYPTFRERSETPKVSLAISLQPFDAYGVDGVILFSDILTPLPAIGVDFSVSEGGKINIDAIRTREDFATLKQDVCVEDFAIKTPFVGQVLEELKQELSGGKATLLGFCGMPFTVASYLMEGKTGVPTGFAQCKTMMKEDPYLVHDILQLLSDTLSEYARYQIEHGAQVLQLFDSWAGHMPKKQYDEFCAPYQKRVIQRIRETHHQIPIIIYMAPGPYSQGGQRLEQLAQTGADFVSVDHTVDMAFACEIIPNEIGLQGNLDPQLLKDGPLDEIRKATERILDQVKGRKHIMNLGHGIDAATPEEHAAYFIQTVQNYPRGMQETE